MDVVRTPGVRTFVIHLYSLPSQGEYTFRADVSFILEGGIRSVMFPRVGLNLNEGRQLTVGSGGWSDNGSRYLSATLVLKPAEKKDTYVIEISCWLDVIGG